MPSLDAGRETRLGLVIYGGVSLAIYTNGVSREFFEAVRGRGVYRLLKRLTDSDLVVDIVSGTSAGGINGIFLGYALCNDVEFGKCAQLWREHGGIANLLRDLDAEPEHYTSLLDSEGYYLPRIQDALATMATFPAKKLGELPSEVKELDLFVTGTDFDGRVVRKTDATGRQIDIKDHKTVFHLKHRKGRKTPFDASDDTGRNALAKLATITSCFPAAFTPVRVTPGAKPPNEVDDKLAEWGAISGERYFLDGGVLDNKPFTHTIHEIFHRTSVRPVTRKLFYVEPDPDRFDPIPRKRSGPPNVTEAISQALLGIPGYESIGDDLALVASRNDKIERFNRIERAFRAYLYEAASARQDQQDAPRFPEVASEATRRVYEQARLLQICARTVQGLLGASARGSHEREKAGSDWEKQLVDAFYNWEGNGSETLERFDVYFRIRRVFHLIYRVAEEVDVLMAAGGSDTERIASLRAVWSALNHQLKILEIIQSRMENLVDGIEIGLDEIDGATIWATLNQHLASLLAWSRLLEAGADRGTLLSVDPSFDSKTRAQLASSLDRRIVEIRHSADSRPISPAERTILQELDGSTHPLATRLGLADPLHAAFHRFGDIDAHLFPIEYFADLGEKDPITIVRVSPMDAVRGFCRQSLENKVTGEALMHFSAFLKRSWRSNDILWGRLDGLCRLLDGLLTEEALDAAMASPSARQQLRDDTSIDPTVLFPRSESTVQAQLRTWLENLGSEDRERRSAAIKSEAMRDLVLAAAQLEIIHDDLKSVMVDAAVEQFEWNAFSVRARSKTPPTFDPTGMKFVSGNAMFDPLSVVVASREMADAAFSRLTTNGPEPASVPSETALGTFFANSYHVGTESMEKSIPPLVLLEVLTSALMVFRNCLLQAFPRGSARLTGTWLYSLLIDYPLRAAHTFAVLGRRAPAGKIALASATFAVAVVCLAVAVLHPAILYDAPKGGLQPWRVIGFVGAPLLVLFAGGQSLWLKVRSNHLLVVVAGAFLVAVTVATATLLGAAIIASASSIVTTLTSWIRTLPTLTGSAFEIDDGLAKTLAYGGLAMLVFVPVLASRLRRALTRSTWAVRQRQRPSALPP